MDWKILLRGFLGWLGGALLQLVAVGPDVMEHWTAKRWGLAVLTAAVPGFVALIRGGEKNPTPEEMYEAVHAVKQQRLTAGLEVTDPVGLPLKPTNQP